MDTEADGKDTGLILLKQGAEAVSCSVIYHCYLEIIFGG